MHHSRRTLLALVAAALSAAAGPAVAQAWPSKPVTIVVSYPAGGDTDAIARVYAEKLSARLGQQVLIDNRPGASGTIGNVSVAKAAPDGYTLLFTPSTFPIAQHVLKLGPNSAHDVVKDFTPIIKTGNIPLLIVAAPSVGVKDIKQGLADAKAGKAYTYGSPGSGSPMHIAAEMLNKAAGTKITHVPYRGVAPVVNDALGGHVTMGWITPGAVGQHVQSGKLLPLAVAERQRTKLMPDVPTLIELGYKELDVSAWMGLLGPKGLPADIAQKLNSHFNEILKMPDVVAKMNALGIEPIGGDAAVLAQQVAADNDRFGKLVKEFGITAE
jgi:tripartite-type tricarboxylate transporter receptor subunit TctC